MRVLVASCSGGGWAIIDRQKLRKLSAGVGQLANTILEVSYRVMHVGKYFGYGQVLIIGVDRVM